MNTLIAHSRALYRAGLGSLVEHNVGEARIVEVSNLDELMSRLDAEDAIDLLLLELELPGLGAFSGLRAVRDRLPDGAIIVIADSESQANVLRAIDCGAQGYVPASSPDHVLPGAIKLVLSGNLYVPPWVFRRPRAVEGGATGAAATGPASGRGPFATLTPRQQEVLTLVGQGHSNREIAQKLGIAEGTVRVHVNAVRKALNLRDRTQTALAAARMEFARPEGGPRDPARSSRPTDESAAS